MKAIQHWQYLKQLRCHLVHAKIVLIPSILQTVNHTIKPHLHDTTSCQTGLTNTVWQPCWKNSCLFNRLSNRFDNRLYRV